MNSATSENASSESPSPASAPADALRVEDLTIRYGTFTAVDNLSFALRPGEIFGLLGPNGAGKTSTFLSLTRQVPLSSGRIAMLGHDLHRDFEVLKPQFGYVPDVENHFEEFTAGENLRLFAQLYNVPGARVRECLELVELSREIDLPVKAFSKGMRKKLLLARELLHRPRLLLLDEPTANLDVHSTALIRDLLRGLSRDGVTILLTTHNMVEVEQVCERVAIIHHGKLLELDTPVGFKSRHTERMLDVVFEQDGRHQRLSIDLTDPGRRAEFAQLLQTQIPVTVHTREFNFSEVFLRLTGEKYN